MPLIVVVKEALKAVLAASALEATVALAVAAEPDNEVILEALVEILLAFVEILPAFVETSLAIALVVVAIEALKVVFAEAASDATIPRAVVAEDDKAVNSASVAKVASKDELNAS